MHTDTPSQQQDFFIVHNSLQLLSKIFYIHVCVCVCQCITHIVCLLSGCQLYLQISIYEVKEEDSSHTDKELCGGTEAAQVDSQDPQFLHRLYVW